MTLRSLFSGYLLVGIAVVLPGTLQAAPGEVETAFDPNPSGTVAAIALQPDGKMVIAGTFTALQPNGATLGTPRTHLARLNADGSVDTLFNPNTNVTSGVNCLALQPDGKILVGGSFVAFQPDGTFVNTFRNRLARLNADGSLDTTFDPNVNSTVNAIALQADGKILIGGYFTSLQPNGAAPPTTRNYLARLNANGTLDTAFDPNTNAYVNSLVVQPDGKILVGGDFTKVQPNGGSVSWACKSCARLFADGTFDSTFTPNASLDVFCTAIQADGKVILGGYFLTVQPNGTSTAVTRNHIARINADGTLDTAFNPNANGSVLTAVPQTDGKILIGGSFTTLQPVSTVAPTTRNRIARLNADGSLDPTFDPNLSSDATTIVPLADGRLLVGGQFTRLQPNGATLATPRNYFARLTNDAATQSLTIPSSSRVQWLRGGAAPEIPQATFELSTDGGTTWSLPNAGSRIAGGWEYTGLNLPASGLIRARGRVGVGTYLGSSGITEKVEPFPPAPLIAIEQPVGVGLIDAGSQSFNFGTAPLGGSGITKTFTIRNTGNADLTINTITKESSTPAVFLVDTTATSVTVPPEGTTTFNVTFAPNGTLSGYPYGTLHVLSNVSGASSSFEIYLTGTGLSTTADRDGDGLPDYTEYLLAAFGFDWTTSQPALVAAYYANASAAGLYTTAQVQALNVGTPLIQKDASTGQFKLTVAVQQSADLKTFSPLSLSTGTTINSAGALEFRFYGPNGTAFYRVQAQ